MKKNILFFATLLIGLISLSITGKLERDKGWIRLFNGKSLDGWKASNNPGTFSVEDSCIKELGPTCHLYYEGPLMDHNFTNFEFKAMVMTKPGSNSGIYFHTAYQGEGFPDRGFEVQINNSYSDWRRTGSLYDIKEVSKLYVEDNVWFSIYIRVQNKHVIVKINNIQVIDWTQPDDFVIPQEHSGRIISKGTFALQGHKGDRPISAVFFKDIMVKPLP